jgi:hypothetical protein
LGLYSTYERKHVAFDFLNLADFTLDCVLQFHLFACMYPKVGLVEETIKDEKKKKNSK